MKRKLVLALGLAISLSVAGCSSAGTKTADTEHTEISEEVNGEMPELPEGVEPGEMPELLEGMDTGEMPMNGERPAAPPDDEMNGERPQPPTDGQKMMQPGELPQDQSTDEATNTEDA